jgi:predicted dienelactone hydrolase
MRCVGYLTTRPEVDAERIGCAGLSLGGEMAMHLGAADTRVKAIEDSSGLTTVAALLIGGCPCWKFPGYVENFDTPDFFCMIAPRWVMTQNGEKDNCVAFLPKFARPAFEKEVLPCYRLFGHEERAVLLIHPGGHEFGSASAIPFLDQALQNNERRLP